MAGQYRSLYYSQRFKEAVEDCEAVLRAHAADEDALWVGAMSLRELGDFRRSVEWFNNLLRVNPARPGADLYANVLTRCIESRSAWDGPLEVRAQGKVVALPQGAAAMFANDYNEMGLYLNGEGQFRAAIQWYDKALEARPHHAIAWFNKGIALARLREFERALESFDEALAIEPAYVDALYSKAGCAFELQQYRVARDCYDEILAMRPNDDDARLCRKQVDEMMKK